ncbi:unnamed protein product, partial [Brassica rapa subsp. trilocularis]
PRPETDFRHKCYRLDREEPHRKDYERTSSALKTISSPRATTPLHRSAPLDSKKRALTKSPPKTPEEAMT